MGAQDSGQGSQAGSRAARAANARGAGIHYDLHDVFVLQCSGRKQWKVHERQSVDPLPRDGVDPFVRSEDLGAGVIDDVLDPGDSL